MKNEQLVQLAREAGFGSINGTLLIEMERDGAPELQAFAKMVAEQMREKCAQLLQEYGAETRDVSVGYNLAQMVRSISVENM